MISTALLNQGCPVGLAESDHNEVLVGRNNVIRVDYPLYIMILDLGVASTMEAFFRRG